MMDSECMNLANGKRLQGFWQEAVQILGEMKAAELVPDLTTCSSKCHANIEDFN